MNIAATYLARNRHRFDLDSRSLPERLSWIAVTPRFRTSAHVVFLALADGSTDPVLVAKVSRMSGRSDALDREAANLRAVQGARAGGFDSVPRLVADDMVADTRLLVETGLAGRLLGAPMVRRRPQACAAALLAWVTELHMATVHHGGDARAAYDRLLAEPLNELERRLPPSSATVDLIARTRELTLPLRDLAIPLVMEHGDLSAPNILVTAGGGLGVVDWELAETESLPGQDLFFALAYLAFARAGATRIDECVAAFRGAFFGPQGWARPYVEAYAASLRLPRAALGPLFVACWSRYVVKRAARLLDPGAARLGEESAAWLTRDRFHALWDHTVRHVDELHLTH